MSDRHPINRVEICMWMEEYSDLSTAVQSLATISLVF